MIRKITYFKLLVSKNSKSVAKITKEVIERYIRENEIELISTHTRLSLPIINRIYKKC
jgi:hypothetical protein